jgi:hypothetical protein
MDHNVPNIEMWYLWESINKQAPSQPASLSDDGGQLIMLS